MLLKYYPCIHLTNCKYQVSLEFLFSLKQTMLRYILEIKKRCGKYPLKIVFENSLIKSKNNKQENKLESIFFLLKPYSLK